MEKIIMLIFALSSVLIMGCDQALSDTNGEVIFDVETLKTPHPAQQSISLFGCNNTNKEKKDLVWGEESSMLLPYGWHNDEGKNYFVAQYYAASPPVPANPKKGQKTTLGLLYKDNFKFKSTDLTKKIKLDYNVLQPMYLAYLNIDFGSCKDKVDTIPINISCPKYPYSNGSEKPASGIGVMENKEGYGKIFIPIKDEYGVYPLQCSASILNDIQLHYKVSFSIADAITENINLTQQLIDNIHPTEVPGKNSVITLICDERPKNSPLPSGCQF